MTGLIQRRFAFKVYKFFDKKATVRGVANNETKQNLQLAELRKLIIRNFIKRAVHSELIINKQA